MKHWGIPCTLHNIVRRSSATRTQVKRARNRAFREHNRPPEYDNTEKDACTKERKAPLLWQLQKLKHFRAGRQQGGMLRHTNLNGHLIGASNMCTWKFMDEKMCNIWNLKDKLDNYAWWALGAWCGSACSALTKRYLLVLSVHKGGYEVFPNSGSRTYVSQKSHVAFIFLLSVSFSSSLTYCIEVSCTYCIEVSCRILFWPAAIAWCWGGTNGRKCEEQKMWPSKVPTFMLFRRKSYEECIWVSTNHEPWGSCSSGCQFY